MEEGAEVRDGVAVLRDGFFGVRVAAAAILARPLPGALRSRPMPVARATARRRRDKDSPEFPAIDQCHPSPRSGKVF